MHVNRVEDKMPRYWVGVVSKNHVLRVEGISARSAMERVAP